MPPVKPDLGDVRITPAQPQVRLERAGVRRAACGGMQFYGAGRVILWRGLDASGASIPYRRDVARDAQPAQWEKINAPTLYAHLAVCHDGETLRTATVALDGASLTEFALEPFAPERVLVPAE